MRYALMLITHGGAPHLAEVLESFAEHVAPRPYVRMALVDGLGRQPALEPLGPWYVRCLREKQGFCRATGSAWQWCRMQTDVDWIVWLENDLRIDRPVDLTALAAVLDDNPLVAQMALMRQPVNAAEHAAGGVVASRPGEFTARQHPAGGWLEQRSYWTTNVSLFRQSLTVEQEWPDGPGCEGRFGIQLRDVGYSFGMWGDGEPWTTHLGDRDPKGFGY